MVEKNKLSLIDTFINFIPVMLAFMMPVFFLPITSEFFELNKLALLTVSTVVLLLLWLIKMITERKVFLTRSIMDSGIWAFFAVVILASAFSLHKVSSIFGSYGRWFPSLLGFAVLISFYYVYAANIKNLKAVKAALIALVAGSTVSTLVAIFSYFGIKLGGAPYFQQPSFTLTGSTTTTALLAVLAVVISLSLMISIKQAMPKALLLQVLLVNLLGVVLIGSTPAYIALGVGALAAFYFSSLDDIKRNQPYLIGLAGVTLALLAIFLVPTTRELVINKDYPKEVLLGAKPSQIISFSVLRDFPLLGSGPSTFYLNFPLYRPVSMNAGNFWNVRFDKPSSELFDIMASMGILGIVATLWFGSRLLKAIFSAKKISEPNGILTPLAASLLGLSVYFVFSYATVLSTYLLFTLLALTIGVLSVIGEKKYAKSVNLTLASFNVSADSILGDSDEKTEILPFIVALPLVALLVFGIYQFSRMYMGEYYMRAAVAASLKNEVSKTYTMQARAININPRRDNYHNSYAQTSILLANGLASKQDLNDNEKALIQSLIGQAIKSSKIVTEVLNPANVSGWETRAFIYRSLVGAAQDADQWAVQAYNTAIQLDPTNPKLRLDLGGLYYAKGDYLNAANMFKQAVALKSDYANARYNFAYALVQLKAYSDAQRELEIVQKMVPAGSADYKKVADDLETIKKAIAQAGTAANTKPTVEQIQASNEVSKDQNAKTQEPLVKPGQEEKVNTKLPTPTPTPTPVSK